MFFRNSMLKLLGAGRCKSHFKGSKEACHLLENSDIFLCKRQLPWEINYHTLKYLFYRPYVLLFVLL